MTTFPYKGHGLHFRQPERLANLSEKDLPFPAYHISSNNQWFTFVRFSFIKRRPEASAKGWWVKYPIVKERGDKYTIAVLSKNDRYRLQVKFSSWVDEISLNNGSVVPIFQLRRLETVWEKEQ